MAERFSAIVSGAVYVDTMVLFGQLVENSQWHQASGPLFRRTLDPNSSVSLVTCALTLDEVVFVYMQEALDNPPYHVTRSRSQYLQRHPGVVRELARECVSVVAPVADLLQVEPVLPLDVSVMPDVMVETGLLPRDAIHLAVMRRLGITAIASDDDAFDGIAGITLYKP